MTTTTEPLKVAHIRRPDLPWRTSRTTECNRLTADVAEVIDRAEALDRIKRYGKQRAAFTLCMTCMSTAADWPAWEDDPVRAMAREFRSPWKADPGLRDELLALAALVEAHREEFDGFMAGVGQTISLADRRRRKVRRR